MATEMAAARTASLSKPMPPGDPPSQVTTSPQIVNESTGKIGPALAGDDIAAHTVQLTKVNGSGGTRVVALDSVDVQFQQGSFTVEMGPSGSGKSTLMHCVAGLDSPTSGRIVIGDTEIGPLKDKQLTQLGRDRIGFVFQAFNAVPTLTAEENILLPPAIAGRKHDPDW